MEIEVIRLTRDDVSLYRDVRLRALERDPQAFGSRHADEAAKDTAWWEQRMNEITRPGQAATFAAVSRERGDRTAWGLAGVYREAAPPRAEWVSMWFDPACHGRGVGRRLVEGVVGWVEAHAIPRLMLCVAEANAEAEGFYRRLAFTPNGVRKPMSHGPNAFEYDMERRCGGPIWQDDTAGRHAGTRDSRIAEGFIN